MFAISLILLLVLVVLAKVVRENGMQAFSEIVFVIAGGAFDILLSSGLPIYFAFQVNKGGDASGDTLQIQKRDKWLRIGSSGLLLVLGVWAHRMTLEHVGIVGIRYYLTFLLLPFVLLFVVQRIYIRKRMVNPTDQ